MDRKTPKEIASEQWMTLIMIVFGITLFVGGAFLHDYLIYRCIKIWK